MFIAKERMPFLNVKTNISFLPKRELPRVAYLVYRHPSGVSIFFIFSQAKIRKTLFSLHWCLSPNDATAVVCGKRYFQPPCWMRSSLRLPQILKIIKSTLHHHFVDLFLTYRNDLFKKSIGSRDYVLPLGGLSNRLYSTFI